MVRRAEGAGLGLTICELTCQAMGGVFALRSQPGTGTVACVQLRAADAQVAEAGPPA
jgi:signal transduction histidine kinase